MGQNFESTISAKAVGTQDVQAQADAIRKLAESIDGLATKANKVNDHPGFTKFAEKVKVGLQDPLGTIASSAEDALKALGPLGVGAAGVAAVLTTAATAGFAFARSLGEYGDRIGDISVRTGLSIKEVGEFSFAMKAAGGDISGVESIMRKLSQGLADNSAEGKKSREGLRDLGITTHGVNGELLPMSGILLQLSQRLAEIPDSATRTTAAVKIMGRGALETLPDLLELAAGVKRARELGLGPSDGDIERWNRYQKQITETDELWEKLKRQLKEPLAATVVVGLRWLTNGNSGPTLPSGVHVGGREDAGDVIQDELTAELTRRLRQSVPTAPTAMLMKSLVSDAQANQSSARGLEKYLYSGLDGAQARLDSLKQKYEEARTAALSLAESGSILPKVAEEHRQKVSETYSAYKAQSDLVKELTKDEERRVSTLEKIRDLTRQGYGNTLEGFYQFDNGNGTTFVTGAQIAAANGGRKGPPSLYGANEYSPARAAAINRQLAPPDLAQGIDPLNGDFVSPSSSRTIQIGDGGDGQLNARQAAFSDKRKRDEEAALNILRGQYEFTAQIVELRTGPGGEVDAANQVAAIRQAALEEEFRRTGDINAYREASQRNAIEHELQLASMQRRRTEEFRSEMGSLFDALPGGRQGIQQFAMNELRTLGRAAFSNAATSLVRTRETLTPGTLFGGTWLGEIFSPVKDATHLNTLATIDNTRALMNFAAKVALSPGAGGGTFSAVGNTLAKYGLPSVSGGGAGYSSDGQPKYAPEYYDPNGVFLGPSNGGHDPSSVGASSRGVPPSFNFAKAAGIGLAGVGAGFGIYSGIEMGGGKGAFTAAGSALAGAGAIISLASKSLAAAGPIGAVLGLALGSILPSLIPDHKQMKAQEFENEKRARAYVEPTGRDYTVDIYGRQYDYDSRGSVRPIVNNHYYTISAIEPETFVAWGKNNPGAIAAVTSHAIRNDGGEIAATLDQVMP